MTLTTHHHGHQLKLKAVVKSNIPSSFFCSPLPTQFHLAQLFLPRGIISQPNTKGPIQLRDLGSGSSRSHQRPEQCYLLPSPLNSLWRRQTSLKTKTGQKNSWPPGHSFIPALQEQQAASPPCRAGDVRAEHSISLGARSSTEMVKPEGNASKHDG